MPAERDRILGDLAVEQGLLATDDAARYYRMIDAAPAGPSLAQLLVRDGRATPQDLERLRALWQSRQAAGARPAAVAAPPPPPSLPPPPAPFANGRAVRPAPPPPFGAGGPPPPAGPAPPPAALDAASLKRDELLARILVARGAMTVDRAREARNLQIQQRVRLAPLLAKMGWVDRARVDEALRFIREQVLLCGRCQAPQDRSRLAPGAPCPACGGPLAPLPDEAPAAPSPPLPPPPAPLPPVTSSALIRPAPQPGRPGPPPGFPAQWGPPPGLEPESATFRTGPPAVPPGLDDPFASARADLGRPPQPQNPNDPRAFFDPMRATVPAGRIVPGPTNVSRDELDPFAQPGGAPPRPVRNAPPLRTDHSVDELDPFAAPTQDDPQPPPAMDVMGGLSQEELNPFATEALPNPPGREADELPTFPPPGVEPLGLAEPEPPPLDVLDVAPPPSSEAPPTGEGEPGSEDPQPRKGKGKKPLRGKRQTNFTPIEQAPQKSSAAGKVVAALVVVAVLAAVGVGAVFTLKSRNVRAALVAADAAFDKKDWAQAREAYLKVLELEKDQPRAVQRRGECERKLDEAKVEAEAKERLDKARAASSPEEVARALAGDGSTLDDKLKERVLARADVQAGIARAKRKQAARLLEQGRKDDATRLLDEAGKAVELAEAARVPVDPIAALERVRYMDARHATAVELSNKLNALAQIDPEGWAGLYARGRHVLMTSPARAEEALKLEDEALAKAGDHSLVPEALWVRARAKLRTKKPGAKEDLEKAAAADPDDYRYLVELAKVALDVDRKADEAARLLAKAEKRAGPDPEAIAAMAEVALRLKKLDDADARAGEAIKLDVGCARAKKVRALVALERNQTYPEILGDLNLAITENPDDAPVRLERAKLMLSRKQFVDAVTDLDTYTKTVGFDPVVSRLRARAYAEGLRKFDEAIGELDAVLEKDPKNGEVLAERGALYLERKISSKAVDDLSKAIELLSGPALAACVFQRGLAFNGAGKYKEALDDFERYLKEWPQGPSAGQAQTYANECRQKVK